MGLSRVLGHDSREAVLSGRTFYPDLVGAHLLLPQLRGFWPMSSVDENGAVYDLSGQGRVLTNTGAVAFSLTDRHVPYADFDGTTGDSLNRADEAGLDITGELTLGFWTYLRDIRNVTVAGKRGAASGPYYFNRLAGATGKMLFIINNSVGNAPGLLPTLNVWQHWVGRFTPSTKIDLFLNGKLVDTKTNSIPAIINNTADSFRFGERNIGEAVDGGVTLGFLCATAVSDDLILWLYKFANQLMLS